MITALKSRTVWALIFLIATNVVSALSGNISPDILVLINSILGSLAIYFKLNPSQAYTV